MQNNAMKSMVITEHGDTSVINSMEVPVPNIDEHDLLVKVLYSSTNPVDNLIRTGLIAAQAFPTILGFDVCGTVKSVGKKVKDFKPGDIIAASPNLMKNGANAEYVSIDSRSAIAIPASIDPEIAGVFPLVALTAWECLFDRAKISKNDTVLIHAGAGGVGHIAIQLAKEAGCRIITTASRPESIALCKDLGADHVINFKQSDFVDAVNEITEGQGCHAIFDFVGEECFNKSMACTRVNGQIVTVKPSKLLADCNDLLLKNITVHYQFVGVPTVYGIDIDQQAHKLKKLFAKVESGTIKPVISKKFSITDLAEAHKLQEKGGFTGKISISHSVWNE